MKLKQLLQKFSDEEIIKQLIKLYPDQKKNRKGYAEALIELRQTRWLKTESKIEIKNEEEDGEKWVNLTVIQGSEHYSASFVEWGLWMEMDIIADNFSEIDIVCHCLWELTWYGYSDKSTQRKFEELNESAKKISKEEKLASGKTVVGFRDQAKKIIQESGFIEGGSDKVHINRKDFNKLLKDLNTLYEKERDKYFTLSVKYIHCPSCAVEGCDGPCVMVA